MQNDVDFGTPECLTEMWRIVAEQALLLGQIIPMLRDKPPEQFPFAHLLFNAVFDSGHSFMLLLENHKLRDCFPLARCVLETTINACFIAALGPQAGSQAMKHAVQKAHRDNSRGFQFRYYPVKVGWVGPTITPTHPVVKEAFDEYSSKKGREITSWTAETLNERVEQIEAWLGKSSGDHLRFSIFSIYGFASEIAHGTLYSVLRFVGVWDIPPHQQSASALTLHQGGLGTEAALNVANCLNIAIHAACQLVGDLSPAVTADDLFQRIKKMRWAQDLELNERQDAQAKEPT
jgi:Family of unknown function (DUF5677)